MFNLLTIAVHIRRTNNMRYAVVSTSDILVVTDQPTSLFVDNELSTRGSQSDYCRHHSQIDIYQVAELS